MSEIAAVVHASTGMNVAIISGDVGRTLDRLFDILARTRLNYCATGGAIHVNGAGSILVQDTGVQNG